MMRWTLYYVSRQRDTLTLSPSQMQHLAQTMKIYAESQVSGIKKPPWLKSHGGFSDSILYQAIDLEPVA